MKIKKKLKIYSSGGKDEDKKYQEWKSKLPKNLQYEGDYDLRGFYNENPNFNVNYPNQHLTDKFKLPNHPTFSNESKYFNMIQPQILNQAGHWQETDSSFNYIPYNTMYKDTLIEMKQNGGLLNKYPNGGREPIVGTLQQYQAYQDSLFIHNDGERMRNLLINPNTTENSYRNEVNRYYTGNFINNNNPTNQAISRLNQLNGEFPSVESTQNRTFSSGYNAYASLFKKPVQPIVLDRPKENISSLDNNQQLIPQTKQHLDFDPIGLKKGTYFTRPRQQQEAGQGSVDYFDNKTGKLLKTMQNGGNINNIEMAKNGIKINPKNKGKFNATKKATGKTTEELTHSKNPITKKRAVFAQNASHWNKKADGGYLPMYYGGGQPSYEDIYNQPEIQLLPERTDYNIGNFNKIGETLPQQQINLGNTIPNYYNFDTGLDQVDTTRGTRPQEQTYQMAQLPTQLLPDNNQLPTFKPLQEQTYQPKTNINWKNAFPGITGIGGNTFLSKGISQLGSGLTNIGKGSLDMIGNMRMNNREQQRNAKQFQQSVYSDAEQITPYNIYGKDIRGGNAFFANGGMSIKEIGGQGQANVEVEGGGGNSEGEHILLPNGFSEAIRGETHANDGVKLNLPANSMIFSEKLKDPTTSKSYSKLAKPFETKKDVNRQIDKRADDLQKKTADLNIKFKENKLKALFEQQENNKLMGEHGKKVQIEAIEQLNPMAENGKLIKAEDGFYNGNLTQIPLQNKSYSPGDARDIIKTFLESPDYKYKNTPEDLKKGKERLKQQLKLNNSLTPELEISINKAPSFQALNPIAGQLQTGTWNLHPEATQHYGLNIAPTRKGLQYLVDNNLINPKDYPSFVKNGKVSIGSMKDFPDTAEAQKLKSVIEKLPQDKKSSYAETNYKDNEWYYRNPEFKDFKFKNKAEYDKYTQDNASNKYGDYYYSGVEGLYQKPTYPTDTPQLQPITPDPKIEYRDRIKTIKGDTNIDLPPVNLGMALPNVYGRDPLNYYKIQPEFIDPRYLNVQPQLNDITRGVRTVQNNLGDRSTSAIGNSLQAQINAYGQENQVYGNKYNYDRGQDSQAQQFNAQAKTGVDQYNQGTWFKQLEDPIRMREGIIDSQIRTDRVGALDKWNEMNAYNNDKDYILNTFNPGTSSIDFGGVKNTTNAEAKLKEKAKQEVLYKKYLAEAEDNLLTKKNGGKIKMKLKLKK